MERPKLRGSPEAFASRLLGKGVTRTNALESLVIAGFVRGLSVRDVEHTLAEAPGPEATLAKSTVTRIRAALQAEFATWQQRALHGLELDYLYLDATAFKMHPASRRAEPLLCAWGITTDGGKVLVGLAAGGAESYENWLDFLRRLRAGGLRPPLLGVSDGAPGLIRAFQEVFDRSLHQRCLVHKARNVLAKVPKAAQAEVKAAFWAIFDGVEAPPVEAAVAAVRDRARAFGQRYQRLYPAAVACLLDDLPSLTTHLRFPAEHWRRIRHTNLLERTFGESRRRVKVIGRLPSEATCVSLVWAVLARTSAGWRGLRQTPPGIRLRHDLRRQLFESLAVEAREVESAA